MRMWQQTHQKIGHFSIIILPKMVGRSFATFLVYQSLKNHSLTKTKMQTLYISLRWGHYILVTFLTKWWQMLTRITFFQHLLDTAGEEYNKKVDAEIIAYMNQNGYDCKRIQ